MKRNTKSYKKYMDLSTIRLTFQILDTEKQIHQNAATPHISNGNNNKSSHLLVLPYTGQKVKN